MITSGGVGTWGGDSAEWELGLPKYLSSFLVESVKGIIKALNHGSVNPGSVSQFGDGPIPRLTYQHLHVTHQCLNPVIEGELKALPG